MMHDYEVEYDLVQRLLDSPEVKAMVGDHIFPAYIDRGTRGDAVYYDSELDEPDRTKMGVYRRAMRFYVCAVGWDMDRVNRIVAAVQDTLEGQYADPWMEIVAVGSRKDVEDKKYYKSMEFTVQW